MTNSKNLIHSLATIPFFTLSMFGVNLSAIAIPQNTQKLLLSQQTTCSVTNIQTGQLALRFTPNGKSRAGLNNGDTVALLRGGSNPWVYVRVLSGPNSQINGLEGWVNSNYLSCSGESSQSTSGTCDVVGIQTGQLALCFTPNGRSKAGLDNGNQVFPLRTGQDPWVYVRVVRGPNSRVNGLEGWVNGNYLNCD